MHLDCKTIENKHLQILKWIEQLLASVSGEWLFTEIGGETGLVLELSLVWTRFTLQTRSPLQLKHNMLPYNNGSTDELIQDNQQIPIPILNPLS